MNDYTDINKRTEQQQKEVEGLAEKIFISYASGSMTGYALNSAAKFLQAKANQRQARADHKGRNSE